MHLTTLLQFIGENPLTAILLIYFGYLVAALPFRAFKLLIRHLNIRKQGWPPPHCDADGDLYFEEPEQTEETPEQQ